MSELSRVDRELSDIYHFIQSHGALPAHKGYKLYKAAKATLDERSQIKLKLNAISQAIHNKAEPYTPRTPLYGKLCEELD